MRQERTIQATIFEVFAQHEIGCELKAMSQWMDSLPQNVTTMVSIRSALSAAGGVSAHGVILSCRGLDQRIPAPQEGSESFAIPRAFVGGTFPQDCGVAAPIHSSGATLMLATSAIAIGLSRSAWNLDPAKTQVRR
jgi:hypothetical protein